LATYQVWTIEEITASQNSRSGKSITRVYIIMGKKEQIMQTKVASASKKTP